MTIRLNLTPELEAGLLAHARATGLTLEGYLQQIVEKDLAPAAAESEQQEGSGMVWENGLFVYRSGTPLPDHILDSAIRRSREERAQHLLGDNS